MPGQAAAGKRKSAGGANDPLAGFDWQRIAETVLLSRALDRLEEEELLPGREIFYQFSARGHDVAQVILASLLGRKGDAISGYYRSRPALLTIGVTAEQCLASSLMKQTGYSAGRDIGAVFNYPNPEGCSALPMCGGVGAQYTPAAGWAQALRYRREKLGDSDRAGAIAVAHGGEASVATNGFWSALTMATTLELPVLFYIEDNGYGISVPGELQTPGADIAANLASFKNLEIWSGDGTDPAGSARLAHAAVSHVRAGKGAAMLHLRVPRLSGHSAQDTQAYKSEKIVAAEKARDPLPKLKGFLLDGILSEEDWKQAEERVENELDQALNAARKADEPDTDTVTSHVFFEGEMQVMGGPMAEGINPPEGMKEAKPEGSRINMVTAIRRTFETELVKNDRLLIFGEDIGPKGGVHAVTMGLQDKFGKDRVFDTSLSEEGIIGRAVGMALCGLMPAPEIQFRKYADPATEQLNDTGTMRWRTNNRFAAPMMVRMPVGFFKCGDPWHSQTDEVRFVHSPGWRVAIPSNAQDAAGLLRTALRGNDPVIFMEHRNMLDSASARRPWPGDDFVVPFGKAARVAEGDAVTVVTWGAMVDRCRRAAEENDISADILDLRTLMPWDREAVLDSVARTHRCLVVHEDGLTAGFGAEVQASVGKDAFLDLDAPLERLAMPDIPPPHSPVLLNAVVPDVDEIAAAMKRMIAF